MPQVDMEMRAYWARIRKHYAECLPAIIAERSNEWGIDPYAWDDHRVGIRLSPIENALWHDIRMCNAVMYPQFPVGRFFVDFGNPVAKVAIECDGAKFHTDAANDRARQNEIEAEDWTVYRISGRDCNTEQQEHEDPDSGHITVTRSAAREFMLHVCSHHRISRFDGA